MPYRFNLFSKIVVMIVLLLIPIILLYSLTNQTSKKLIREQLESSNLTHLSFLMRQVDSHFDQLSMFPVIISNDPYLRLFIDDRTAEGFNFLKEHSKITERLSLQSVSSNWFNHLMIILPREHRILSSDIFVDVDNPVSGETAIRNRWVYEEERIGNKVEGFFLREFGEPAHAKYYSEAVAIYQVKFSEQNIIDMLNEYKQDKKSDPYMYHANFNPIITESSASDDIQLINSELNKRQLEQAGQLYLDLNAQKHLISYVQSNEPGWFLIDYVPVENILSPITKTQNLFYYATGLLLIVSILTSFLLYRNVQIPILKLIKSVQHIKRGDFSSRIEHRSRNEFDFLIQRFNEMVAYTQRLIEDVYAEKIRSREASLKQLQSQVNPHFLYNSLFFIINSSKMGDHDSVQEMAQNLAEFYRYTTRVENQIVTLQQELDMVKFYLASQYLRLHTLEYSISVPEEMMAEQVPILILQPLVENAIVHGVGTQAHGGEITISGKQDESYNYIFVTDDGGGMSEKQLQLLRIQLNEPMSEEVGCGTWNVHQRLFYKFGQDSGLEFHHVSNGGLQVVVKWNRKQNMIGE